jgi:hypothetical protein
MQLSAHNMKLVARAHSRCRARALAVDPHMAALHCRLRGGTSLEKARKPEPPVYP